MSTINDVMDLYSDDDDDIENEEMKDEEMKDGDEDNDNNNDEMEMEMDIDEDEGKSQNGVNLIPEEEEDGDFNMQSAKTDNLICTQAECSTISVTKELFDLKEKEIIKGGVKSRLPSKSKIINVDLEDEDKNKNKNKNIVKKKKKKSTKKKTEFKKPSNKKKKRKKKKKKTKTKKRTKMSMDYPDEYDDEAYDKSEDEDDKKTFAKEGSGWNRKKDKSFDPDAEEDEEVEYLESDVESDNSEKEEEERRKQAMKKRKKKEKKKKKKEKKEKKKKKKKKSVIKLFKKSKEIVLSTQYNYAEGDRKKLKKNLPGITVLREATDSINYSLQFPNCISIRNVEFINFTRNDGKEVIIPCVMRGGHWHLIKSTTYTWKRMQCDQFDINPIKNQVEDFGTSAQRDAKLIHSYYDDVRATNRIKAKLKFGDKIFKIPFSAETIEDNDNLIKDLDDDYEKEYRRLHKKRSRKRKRTEEFSDSESDEEEVEVETQSNDDDVIMGEKGGKKIDQQKRRILKIKGKKKESVNPPKTKKRKIDRSNPLQYPIVQHVMRENLKGNYFSNNCNLSDITTEEINKNINTPGFSFLLAHVQNTLGSNL